MIHPERREVPVSDVLARRIVPFYGDEIIAVQHPNGSIYVLFARVCENLGLARRGQVVRVQRHAVLSRGLEMLQVEAKTLESWRAAGSAEPPGTGKAQ